MNQSHRAKLQSAVDRADDLLHDIGALKGRDPREPGRRRKQRAETRLTAAVQRHFRRQRAALERMFELMPPAKAAKAYDKRFDDVLEDDEFAPQVYRLMFEFAKDGVTLFSEQSSLTLNYTLTNVEAAKWARKYSYALVKDIDATTRKALQSAVSAFVETPGYTLGDLMGALPFDANRAMNVGVTEITRAYSQANVLAGQQMKEEYPDVRVVKSWQTNRDDAVCPLCSALDGREVDVDQPFYSADDHNDGEPPRHVSCRCWTTVRTRING